MTNVAAPLLEIRGLCRRFGHTVALDGINTTVEAGSVHCIIGPSGCGKSTLLRCINWLETPEYGEISLRGEIVGTQATPGSKLSTRQLRKLNLFRAQMGMVFQGFNVWPHLSVLENVVRAQVVVLKRSRTEAEANATQLLDRVDMAHKLGATPRQLSGGQLQRVAIARALAMDPLLLLLDEPTSALDPELIGEVLSVLRGLAREGMTMMVVTHELGFARHVADEILFMDQGKIVEQGPPDSVIDNPQSERLQTFLQQLNY